MDQPRVWLITGASSGFGRHITEHLLSINEIVVATLRTPSVLSDLVTKYPSSQLLVTKCDVSELPDILAAFQEAKKAFGRIDVVFNNAGFGVFGEIEGIDEKKARAMFDVNFWGAGNVNREAVRFFREENPKGFGGLLLVNTSVVGIFAPPTSGYYSSCKFALEAVTEALALEIDPAWNIKISIIEPGSYDTHSKNDMIWSSMPPAYAANPNLAVHGARAQLEDTSTKCPGDPKKTVKRIVEFAFAKLKTDVGDTTLPFRWLMGQDTVAVVKQKVQSVSEDAVKSET